jgi:hypothetical protein
MLCRDAATLSVDWGRRPVARFVLPRPSGSDSVGSNRVVNYSSTIIWHHIAMPDENHLISNIAASDGKHPFCNCPETTPHRARGAIE